MKVILCLGNPGREYERTRHNVGWWVADYLADVWHLDGWRHDGEAKAAAGRVAQHNVRVLKPQTYMNLSGSVLRPYAGRALWSHTTDLLVVVDDMALLVGTYRLRARGSAGGHNGLKSVESVLGSREYSRLRVGIQPLKSERMPSEGDLAAFVLSPFEKAERATVMDLMPSVGKAVETWIHDGVGRAMNEHNRSAAKPR